ncbi:hypothetical protein IQ07DRAFT_647370 [Pyrenochaeta sp. DS3sAY3a]|nr:hypothetical protein IQ07DRAFT_647370 [Pyrenochaeta sp. DS3sAY3a]
MVRAIFVVLGLVAAVFAQESSYTGPLFNPSDAPFFGPSSLVIPTLSDQVPTFTQTPTFIRSRSSSAASASVTASRSSSHVSSSHISSSHSTSASASRSATPSVSVSSSASAPAVSSTGAAVMNYPGVVGVIAGGLAAGLALA